MLQICLEQSKTQYMKISRISDESQGKPDVLDYKFQKVGEFKYFGTSFTRNSAKKSEVELRIASAGRKYWRLVNY